MSSRPKLVVALIALALAGGAGLLSGSPLSAQRRGIPAPPLPEGQTNDPFPQPIARDEGVVTVRLRVRLAARAGRRSGAHDDAGSWAGR